MFVLRARSGGKKKKRNERKIVDYMRANPGRGACLTSCFPVPLPQTPWHSIRPWEPAQSASHREQASTPGQGERDRCHGNSLEHVVPGSTVAKHTPPPHLFVKIDQVAVLVYEREQHGAVGLASVVHKVGRGILMRKATKVNIMEPHGSHVRRRCNGGLPHLRFKADELRGWRRMCHFARRAVEEKRERTFVLSSKADAYPFRIVVCW